MTGRAAGLWVAGAVVMGLALRLWAFAGVSGAYLADDTRYVAVAQNLAHGFAPSGDGEWFGARVVFLWPVAGLFRLFGAGDVTAVAWPLAASVAAVAATYLLAAEITGKRRVGVVAAVIAAASPLDVLVASRLRPDAVMPLFVVLAVWAACRARRTARGLWWAAAAGALLAAAWSAREMALVMAPVVVLAAWRPSWRALAAGVAGFAAVVAACCGALAAVGGDPLMPLTGTAGATRTRAPWDAFRWGDGDVAWAWRHALDAGHPAFLLVPAVVVVAAVLAFTRPRRALVPAAWLAWGLVYLEFLLLVSLTPSPRFLTMLTAPAAVLAAMAADRLPAWGAPVLPAAAVVAAALAAAPVADRVDRDANVWRPARVAAWLRDHADGHPALSTDYITYAKVRLYVWRGRLRVPVADDPGFLTGAQRDARAREDLPAVDSFRDGYVVRVADRPQRGQPANWRAFRADVRRTVRVRDQSRAAGWDDAEILRWTPPDGATASPSRR